MSTQGNLLIENFILPLIISGVGLITIGIFLISHKNKKKMNDSGIIFNQLKEYWFNKKCQDEFDNILNDNTLNSYEREIKCMDYLQNTFDSFAKEKNYKELNYSIIEVIINWGILMHLQIKDKIDGNENNF
jgi:hypothetical protein